MDSPERRFSSKKPINPCADREQRGEVPKGYGEEHLVRKLAEKVVDWVDGPYDRNPEDLEKVQVDIARYEIGIDSYHEDSKPHDPNNIDIGSIEYRAGVTRALEGVMSEFDRRDFDPDLLAIIFDKDEPKQSKPLLEGHTTILPNGMDFQVFEVPNPWWVQVQAYRNLPLVQVLELFAQQPIMTLDQINNDLSIEDFNFDKETAGKFRDLGCIEPVIMPSGERGWRLTETGIRAHFKFEAIKLRDRIKDIPTS